MFKSGEKTCGSAQLTLVSLVFGVRTFHSFSVHHSSTDAHKNTCTLTSGVSLSVLRVCANWDGWDGRLGDRDSPAGG